MASGCPAVYGPGWGWQGLIMTLLCVRWLGVPHAAAVVLLTCQQATRQAVGDATQHHCLCSTLVVACPRLHQVHPGLRERYFGAALELTSHEGYCPAWEADAADPASRPGGDGESAADVAQRLLQLMEVSTTASLHQAVAHDHEKETRCTGQKGAYTMLYTEEANI
jgi:broad specificity phosphatase PhoE